MNLSVILGGIIGTAAMTIFIEGVARSVRKPFHVIPILAMMLTFQKQPSPKKFSSYLIAFLVHYGIGVLFAWCFKLCIDANLLGLNALNALLFGCVAGLIGIVGWLTFFALHPAPPQLNLGQYLSLIGTGHLVFSLGLYFAYLNMLPKNVETAIPIC